MKEKLDRKINMVVQVSLYEEFKDVCEERYKTVSEVIRDFMLQYIKEHKNGKKSNNKRI